MPAARVLIVDDSELSREVLRKTLEHEGHLHVVGEARTGEEALAKVRELEPHLVTMDLNMPGMGGLKAIEALMRDRPTPIVVISERSSTSGVDLNYEAISRGALELVPKSAVFGADADELTRFVARLKALAEAGLELDDAPVATAPAPPVPLSTEPPLLVGIGASTGGPRALAKLLGALPKNLSVPVVLVQHMAEDFFDSFVRFLKDASGQKVVQATASTVMEAGTVYVAPPRSELFVRENYTVRLLPPPPAALISPSVDSLFFSMASVFRGRSIGVLLTGMGDDGAQGLLRMRRMGARTLIQDKASCAVFGMPKAALELGAASQVLALEKMGATIAALLTGAVTESPIALPKARTDSAPELPRVRGKKRVLVVDDDASSMEQTRGALDRAGYDVVTLDNPLVLARVLRRNPADLVVLEPMLSTMKGSVVAQTLRTFGHAVPLFLVSRAAGVALNKQIAECQASGGVSKDDVAAMVREVGRLFRGRSERLN